MNSSLYEFLINNRFYTHSIGRINEPDTILKLESIFRLEALYSKDKLRSLGIKIEGKVVGNIRITKEAFVSLFDPTSPALKKRLLSSNYRLFHILAILILYF